MPRGTFHEIRGTLRETQLGYIVELDGGGFWVLDVSPRKVRRLVGQQVVAEGVRVGFNELAVRVVSHSFRSAK